LLKPTVWFVGLLVKITDEENHKYGRYQVQLLSKDSTRMRPSVSIEAIYESARPYLSNECS